MPEGTISVRGYAETKAQVSATLVPQNVSTEKQDAVEAPNYAFLFESPIHEKKISWFSDRIGKRTKKILYMLLPCRYKDSFISRTTDYELPNLNWKYVSYGVRRMIRRGLGDNAHNDWEESWKHVGVTSGADIIDYVFGRYCSWCSYLSSEDKSRVRNLLYEEGQYLESPKKMSKDLEEFQDYVSMFKNFENFEELVFPDMFNDKFTDKYEFKNNIGFKTIMALKDIYNLSPTQAKMLAYLFAHNNSLEAIKDILNSKKHKLDFKIMLIKLRILETWVRAWGYDRKYNYGLMSEQHRKLFHVIPRSVLRKHDKSSSFNPETMKRKQLPEGFWDGLEATPAVISWVKSAENINALDETLEEYGEFKKYKKYWIFGEYIDKFVACANRIKDWNFAPLVLSGLTRR